MRRPRILHFLALCLAGAACGGPSGPGSTPVIVVSVPPQAWFVERLLGDGVRARIEIMIPAGSSSEVEAYSPTPSQMRSLEQAELYVKVGHPLISVETACVDPLVASHAGIAVIDMGEGIRQGTDPHIWVSPATAKACVRNIGAGLAKHWPEHAAGIGLNLERLLAEVDSIDAGLRRRLEACPRRVFLVDHPALGYLARDYGLRQIAIEDEGKEPGLARLTGIIDEAKREGVTSVFTQAGFPQKPAELIARALGGTVVRIDVLDRDWAANTEALAGQLAAALGAPGAPDSGAPGAPESGAPGAQDSGERGAP